jgi:hypothetical protein
MQFSYCLLRILKCMICFLNLIVNCNFSSLFVMYDSWMVLYNFGYKQIHLNTRLFVDLAVVNNSIISVCLITKAHYFWMLRRFLAKLAMCWRAWNCCILLILSSPVHDFIWEPIQYLHPLDHSLSSISLPLLSPQCSLPLVWNLPWSLFLTLIFPWVFCFQFHDLNLLRVLFSLIFRICSYHHILLFIIVFSEIRIHKFFSDFLFVLLDCLWLASQQHNLLFRRMS